MSDEKNDKEKAGAIIGLFNSFPPIVKSIIIGGLLGSIVPVAGTIIGAIIGGVVGFLWFKNEDDEH